MPEGHTIHRLAREHLARFGGMPLRVTSPQGRFADGAELLDGHVLDRVDAYGKHLFLGFGPDRWLHIHLGLYGSWTFGVPPVPEPRGALRVRLVGNGSYADLRGPTACDVLTPPEKSLIEARLGPDPLRPRPDPEPAWVRISRSRAPIAALLMDQTVLAGVGNVYRAEVLFRARLAPSLPGRTLPREVFDDLWADLVTVLKAGLRSGRIVTTLPAHRPRTGRVRQEDRHYVYRRTGLPCRVCGTPVASAVLVGRNLFWCPTCQQP